MSIESLYTKHITLMTLMNELLEPNIVLKSNLKNIEEIESNYTVLRLSFKLDIDFPHSSVIVKHLGSDNSENRLQHFKNEMASIMFIQSIDSLKKYVPKIIASDLKNYILVLEDFGKTKSIMDLMYDKDRKKAITYLKKYIEMFAFIHGKTIGKEQEFRKLQIKFKAESPVSDSTLHLTSKRTQFEEIITQLLQFERNSSEFNVMTDELNKLDSYIKNLTPDLKSFIHCDSGLQNNLIKGKDLKIIDFEYGDFGFPLLDIAGIYLGFPQSWKGKLLPQEIIETLEKIYYSTLKKFKIINSKDTYKLVLHKTLAHWIVCRLTFFWDYYLKDRIAQGKNFDKEFIKKHNSNKERFLSLLSSTYTYHIVFKRLYPNKMNFPLVIISYKLIEYFEKEYPGIKKMDYFSVFNS